MKVRPRLRPGVDIGVAVGLTLFSVLALPFLEPSSDVDAAVGPPAFVLAVVAGLAVAVRTWWPARVLAVTAAATATYLALEYPYGPIYFSFALAVYALGRRVPLLPAIAWSAAALVAVGAHVFTSPAALPLPVGLAPVAAWVAVPFTIGVARRMVLESQARERAETERRVIETERLRLAQEVHDVVGHGLAAIQMQADIALHVAGRRPEQALETLAAISRASDQALTELRTTLARITPGEQPSRAPTPGLAELHDLCERVRAAGVEVDLRVRGAPPRLPSAVDLTAYRVLQESLTNVVKHAAAPHAVVTVVSEPDRLELAVANEQLVAAPYAEGFGVTGMRRRVTQVGGTFTAGPVTRRCDLVPVFEVRAVLPAGGGR